MIKQHKKNSDSDFYSKKSNSSKKSNKFLINSSSNKNYNNLSESDVDKRNLHSLRRNKSLNKSNLETLNKSHDINQSSVGDLNNQINNVSWLNNSAKLVKSKFKKYHAIQVYHVSSCEYFDKESDQRIIDFKNYYKENNKKNYDAVLFYS